MTSTRVLSAEEVESLVGVLDERLAQVLAGVEEVVVVGVRRGGVGLAGRLTRRLRTRGVKVELGTVDIALYRDDAHLSWPRAETGPTEISFPIDGRQVLVVDDVFWTGRTARAAIDAVLDFGRPARLWLAVLVVRSGRELPIVPDFHALELSASPSERVEVRLGEEAGPDDEVLLREVRT